VTEDQLRDPEDESSIIFRNAEISSPKDTVSRPRIFEKKKKNMLIIADLKIHRNTEVKLVTVYNVLIRINDSDTAVTTIGLFRPIKCVSEEVISILHSLLCLVNFWTNSVPEAHVSKAQQELNYFFLHTTQEQAFFTEKAHTRLLREVTLL
jgi:hypothetical protein